MPVQLPENIFDAAGNPVRVVVALLVDESGEAATIEGGGGGTSDPEVAADIEAIRALTVTQNEILTETPGSLPAPALEPLNGPNGLAGVPVALSGDDTQTIGAADADEAWSVYGWLLAFTEATTLTFSNGETGEDLVLPVGQAAWSEKAGGYAWFSAPVNTAITLSSSAGDVTGYAYLKKE